MSDIDEVVRRLCTVYPPLEEYSDEIKEILEQFRKRNEDMRFRIIWLENVLLRLLQVVSTLLSEDQKKTDEYKGLNLMIHKHIKRFNPESYEQHLSNYRALSEQSILKLGVHPEEEIEKLRKIFDLEDIPKIITFDFIKTHFGEEQLEIYNKILEEDTP